MTPSTQASLDVLRERHHQKTRRFSDAHDDGHKAGELVRAAVAYAKGSPRLYPWLDGTVVFSVPPRERLVRAAALLIAEIERLDRVETPQ